MKVETHNHPTAISPCRVRRPVLAVKSAMKVPPGAQSRKRVRLVLSNLAIPGFEQPWKKDFGKPERIVTALDIMTGPAGGAAFNNEFGRPALNGYSVLMKKK